MKCNKLFIGIALMLLQVSAEASQNLWQEVSSAQRAAAPQSSQAARYYRSDTQTLKQILARAGIEGGAELDTIIELPLANGQIKQFRLIESSVMAPELAAKYPDIKTYKVIGIENPLMTGRLSYTTKGFSAMVSAPVDTYYLDPTTDGLFRATSKSSSNPGEPFNCGVVGHSFSSPVTTSTLAARAAQRVAGSMRLYRIAVAATAEYVDAVGGTSLAAMSEITKTINRVNEIYQRDLGVKLELVANNDSIIFDGPARLDPYPAVYSSLGLEALLPINQTTLDSRIGADNYDIGHVFTSGQGNGVAQVGAVCTSIKAYGATSLSGAGAIGDGFYIDYVAHEIGHQFNAQHTFNGTTGACGTRNDATAYEPGSGSSIMAYAGICYDENLQTHSDAHFHAGSIAVIDQFTTQGSGANCGSLQSTGNSAQPVITDDGNYTIPAQTPFVLTAVAEGVGLSYSWDQMDVGASTSILNFGEDLGTNPLFRSYLPRSEEVRHFPALGTTLDNLYDYAEVLPCNNRDINFRLVVRDGNGGVAYDNVKLSVDSSSGPFRVSAFNTAQSVSPGSYLITWDVANTNQPPVNCSSVNISLLTFNSAATTYKETMLSPGEANDGIAVITIPDLSASKARLKVQCENNIFYDISDEYINISGSVTAETVGNSVFYNTEGLTLYTSPAGNSCEFVPAPVTDDTDSNQGSSGAISMYGLFSIFSLMLIRRRNTGFSLGSD